MLKRRGRTSTVYQLSMNKGFCSWTPRSIPTTFWDKIGNTNARWRLTPFLVQILPMQKFTQSWPSPYSSIYSMESMPLYSPMGLQVIFTRERWWYLIRISILYRNGQDLHNDWNQGIAWPNATVAVITVRTDSNPLLHYLHLFSCMIFMIYNNFAIYGLNLGNL